MRVHLIADRFGAGAVPGRRQGATPDCESSRKNILAENRREVYVYTVFSQSIFENPLASTQISAQHIINPSVARFRIYIYIYSYG